MGTPALSYVTNKYYGQSTSDKKAKAVILSIVLAGTITKAKFTGDVQSKFRYFMSAQATAATFVTVQYDDVAAVASSRRRALLDATIQARG